MHNVVLQPSVAANRRGVVGGMCQAVAISVQIGQVLLIVILMVGVYGIIVFATLVMVLVIPHSATIQVVYGTTAHANLVNSELIEQTA